MKRELLVNATPRETRVAIIEDGLRDWDGRFNNERFWSRIYELDLGDELAQAGASRER